MYYDPGKYVLWASCKRFSLALWKRIFQILCPIYWKTTSEGKHFNKKDIICTTPKGNFVFQSFYQHSQYHKKIYKWYINFLMFWGQFLGTLYQKYKFKILLTKLTIVKQNYVANNENCCVIYTTIFRYLVNVSVYFLMLVNYCMQRKHHLWTTWYEEKHLIREQVYTAESNFCNIVSFSHGIKLIGIEREKFIFAQKQLEETQLFWNRRKWRGSILL